MGSTQDCGCGRLHAGARVYISRTPNPGLATYLSNMSIQEGLAVGGVIGRQTEFVIVQDDDGASDKADEARAVGAVVVGYRTYEKMLADVCRAALVEDWATKRVPLKGKKVYVHVKNRDVEAELGTLLASHGAHVGKHILPTLAAAVVAPSLEEDGHVTLLHARGVPVFRLDDFWKLYSATR